MSARITCANGHRRTEENTYTPPGRTYSACRDCNREATARYRARNPKPKKPRPTLEERFWAKVQRSAGCWEWQGARNDQGYGLFLYNGKSTGAHIVALILSGADRPERADACHRCDNPSCVNPRHLYFGTRRQNMADAYARGRRSPGEGHAAAKLTEAEVVEIRARYAAGDDAADLGREYGVATSTIRSIVLGFKWQSAPGPITRRTNNRKAA